VSSYLAISPLPAFAGGLFSVALSVARGLSATGARTLSGIMPFGARTFLGTGIARPATTRSAAWNRLFLLESPHGLPLVSRILFFLAIILVFLSEVIEVR